MSTVSEYVNATPERRAELAREQGWDKPAMKPPSVHNHRGKPRSFEMDGYHEATKPKRTPTHRGVPRTDNTPPWARMLTAIADRAERNRNE